MRRALLPLLVITLSACAGDPDWVNPTVPRAQWSRDLAACRRQADQAIGTTDYYEPDDRSSLPSHMMDREDSRRRFDAYVGACMQDEGYRRGK